MSTNNNNSYNNNNNNNNNNNKVSAQVKHRSGSLSLFLQPVARDKEVLE